MGSDGYGYEYGCMTDHLMMSITTTASSTLHISTRYDDDSTCVKALLFLALMSRTLLREMSGMIFV